MWALPRGLHSAAIVSVLQRLLSAKHSTGYRSTNERVVIVMQGGWQEKQLLAHTHTHTPHPVVSAHNYTAHATRYAVFRLYTSSPSDPWAKALDGDQVSNSLSFPFCFFIWLALHGHTCPVCKLSRNSQTESLATFTLNFWFFFFFFLDVFFKGRFWRLQPLSDKTAAGLTPKQN